MGHRTPVGIHRRRRQAGEGGMVNGTDPPIVKPLARRRLKTTTILVVAFIGLFLVSAVWQKVAFYPKVRGAHITVDGRVCSDCAVYINRRHSDGVFVRRGGILVWPWLRF